MTQQMIENKKTKETIGKQVLLYFPEGQRARLSLALEEVPFFKGEDNTASQQRMIAYLKKIL